MIKNLFKSFENKNLVFAYLIIYIKKTVRKLIRSDKTGIRINTPAKCVEHLISLLLL